LFGILQLFSSISSPFNVIQYVFWVHLIVFVVLISYIVMS